MHLHVYDSVSNHQIINFSSAPNFPAIWYVGPTVDPDANGFDHSMCKY